MITCLKCGLRFKPSAVKHKCSPKAALDFLRRRQRLGKYYATTTPGKKIDK